MMTSSSFNMMRNRDRKHSVYGWRGGSQTEPFTLVIDGQGNLNHEDGTGTNFLDHNTQEYQLVKRHRLKYRKRRKHVRGLYPRLFHVLSGLDVSEKPNATAATLSGVFSSRHQTQHGDATVLIFEETMTSPMSDTGSEITSMILVIDTNGQVHFSDICLGYDENMLSNVTMTTSCAIDYCENWMSRRFKRRDPYNTIATLALSLGVYLSDVKQKCLKKLTDLQAASLEPADKHNVGNITIGDLVAAGMTNWDSSRIYNNIAKCHFVVDHGQLHVVGESNQLGNKHTLAKRDVNRAPRGSGLPSITVNVGHEEMKEFLVLIQDESVKEATADNGEREHEVEVVLCYTGNVPNPSSDRTWNVGHKRIWFVPEGCGSFTDATQGRITVVTLNDIHPEGISISWDVFRSWLRGEKVLTKCKPSPDWEFNLLITNWRPVLYSDRIESIDVGRLKACDDGAFVKAGKRRWALELMLYGSAFASAVLLCIWHAKQGNDEPSEAVSQFIGYLTFTLGVAAFVSLKQRRMTGLEILGKKTWETSLDGVASALDVSVAEISARLTMVDVDAKLLSREDTCACRNTDPDGLLSGVGLTRKFRQTAGYIPVKKGGSENLFVDVFLQRVLRVKERGGRAHFEELDSSLEDDVVYAVVEDKYETAYGREVDGVYR